MYTFWSALKVLVGVGYVTFFPIKRLNLATVKVSELGFKSPFTLTMLKDTMCHVGELLMFQIMP